MAVAVDAGAATVGGHPQKTTQTDLSAVVAGEAVEPAAITAVVSADAGDSEEGNLAIAVGIVAVREPDTAVAREDIPLESRYVHFHIPQSLVT